MIVYYSIKNNKRAWLFNGSINPLHVMSFKTEATFFPGASFDLFAIEIGSVNTYYTLKYRAADFYILVNKEQLEEIFDKTLITSNKIWDSLNG